MWFCPNETSINHFHAFQSLDVLHAKCEELRGLKLTLDPWWALVSVALFAVMELDSSWDSFSDVYL
jgi:hypothetical protein